MKLSGMAWGAMVLVLGACEMGSKPAPAAEAAPAEAAPAPAPAPAEAPAAAGGDVRRYDGEVQLRGGATIVTDVSAHKEAERGSPVIQNLHHGASVTKVAQYGGWMLVSWRLRAGDKQGWIESARAFSGNVRVDPLRNPNSDVLDRDPRFQGQGTNPGSTQPGGTQPGTTNPGTTNPGSNQNPKQPNTPKGTNPLFGR